MSPDGSLSSFLKRSPCRRAYFILYLRRPDRFDGGGREFVCARWPMSLFASPACIFYFVSPPVWSFRRWRRGICLRVPAGRCYCSPRRRAYFILYLRRPDRLAGGGVEFVFVCPLAAAVVRLAGVHFSFCISAVVVVLTVAAWKLPPSARWPMLLFASPACIFHFVSPPA